jgi:hypothetical protein
MTDLAIQLEGVGKKYRYFTLDRINLELPAGQIMGSSGRTAPASPQQYASC